MKNRGLMALLIVILMAASSCATAPGSTPPIGQEPAAEELGTLGEVLAEAGNFTIFLEMVETFQAASIVLNEPTFAPANILNGSDEYTIIAPTDAAFQAAFERIGLTLDQVVSSFLNWDIVFHHIFYSKRTISEMEGTVPSFRGYPVTFDGLKINNANVTTADIEASNGFIHVVDDVVVLNLLPVTPAPGSTPPIGQEPTPEGLGTLGEVLTEAGNFTIFLETVKTYESVAGLINGAPTNILEGSDEYTIFAPTDAAFESAIVQWPPLRNELRGFLGFEIMFYHILYGNYSSSQLPTGNINSVNGYPVPINQTNVKDVASRNPADLEASNGTVIPIDTMMIPPFLGGRRIPGAIDEPAAEEAGALGEIFTGVRGAKGN